MQTAHVSAFTPFHSGATRLAYNETAFRYFIDVERHRARTSRRQLLLVLVGMQGTEGDRAAFTPDQSRHVFAALGTAVRDVDLVGWFREHRVMAVLMLQPSKPEDNVRQIVTDRVRRALRTAAPHVRPLRVRVVSLGGVGNARRGRASGQPAAQPQSTSASAQSR